MVKKRSKGTAGKNGQPAPRWRICPLLGVLLVALLVAATTTAAQLLWAAPSPDSAATASPAANAAGASSEAGASSSTRTLYSYGGQLRPLVEETNGVQTLNIYGPDGQIIAQVARDGQGGREVRHLLADHLGSTRVALDADGNVVARFEYGPYGETAASGTAAADVRYRYTGHPYDEPQGLYETPARQYDPTLGRFLSVDPQREMASPYAYVSNNPVLYKDPTGRGRVGTTVTPQVFDLADKLVKETAGFDSSTWFFETIEDPVVYDFFEKFSNVYHDDLATWENFTRRIMKINDLFSGPDRLSLAFNFQHLHDEVPALPRVNAEQRVSIMSKMEEYHRSVILFNAHHEQRKIVIEKEFNNEKSRFYRSDRPMELMRDPTGVDPQGLDPNAKNGFGNCGDAAECIGGRIAETDREVNVELFGYDRSIDHEFVVVGRDPRTDPHSPLTWNNEALIVDGWLGFVEQANKVYAEGRYPTLYSNSVEPRITYSFE